MTKAIKTGDSLTIPRMRGRIFHNFLVALTVATFRQMGFEVLIEYALYLADGRADYVDLLAWRENYTAICEIETTARHALENLAKAKLLNLPLWIIVPNRKVRLEVGNKLMRAGCNPEKDSFQISMPDELPQRLTDCFPLFSLANTAGKNGKTKKEVQ